MKAIHAVGVALSVILAGVLIMETVIHRADWGRPGDRARNRAAESVSSPAPSSPSAQSLGAPAGYLPPQHHGVIYGSKADDVIDGTEASEKIEGLAGRDRIAARGGDDVLDGGVDADVLMGGSGNDTYIIKHHGGGADVIVEEDGTDTLQLMGGHLASSSIEILRHGNDLLLRWNHERPADAVLIKSWFTGQRYHIERLQLPGGSVEALEPLAAQAREASAEDLIHFSAPR